MNHVYRLVWNDLQRTHVPAAECKRARGKTRGDAADSPAPAAAAPRVLRRLPLWLALAFAPTAALALPQGEQLVAGSATVTRPDAGTLTVEQASARAVLDWQSFSITAGERVRFVQPGRDAVALNRVLGSDPSAIHGSLDANGRVFLVNPNGILFGENASVNVGGLVASTLDIASDDFMNGLYRFGGSGEGVVRNRGRIVAARGGAVALLGGRVINDGTIRARLGTVALASGTAMTLDFAGDGLLNVTVDAGAVDALARNGGLLRADGGTVLMTAVAADRLAQAVVNQQGVIEAQAVDERGGTIRLVAEGEDSLVKLGGTLDASNPAGGAAGEIETRGADVALQPGARVDAGPDGQWTLATGDIHVEDDEAVILGASLDGGTDVTIDVRGTDPDRNHLAVHSRLRWSSDATLRLQAEGDIDIEAAIRAPQGRLELAAGDRISDTAALKVDTFVLESGDWRQRGAELPTFSARDFRLAGGSFLRALGGRGTEERPYRLFDVYGLQGMASADLLGRHFRLAGDIDASGTAQWWGGRGFVPVGSAEAAFTGSFKGRGHVIDGLVIDRPEAEQVGLFGHIAQALVRNVRLENGSVTGSVQVGGLVGRNVGGTVRDSSFSGSVAGTAEVGGLVGSNEAGARIRGGKAGGAVSGETDVGGLVGSNRDHASVADSRADVEVTGDEWVGGLVGSNWEQSSITGSRATGAVSGRLLVGGLAGTSEGGSEIRDSHASGQASGRGKVGGLVGGLYGSSLSGSSAHGDVSATDEAGGLVGGSEDAEIRDSRASGAVSGNVHIGGLVGRSVGSSIRDSKATGRVSARPEDPMAWMPNYVPDYETFFGGVGGLVGHASASTIERSHASGDVSGPGEFQRTGGLVGRQDEGSTIRDSSASGKVTGAFYAVGGLVGESASGSSIFASHASGHVAGLELVGGLVGLNTGGSTIAGSTASGHVSAPGAEAKAVRRMARALEDIDSGEGETPDLSGFEPGSVVLTGRNLGGLVGSNHDHSTISDSSASGSVLGRGSVGGLVGVNSSGSTVERSQASGLAIGTGAVGGLVGTNESSSTVAHSSAAGMAVSFALPPGEGMAQQGGVGGLVGVNRTSATIADSSASGIVAGLFNVGGLAGLNTDRSTVTRSHASGLVLSGALILPQGGGGLHVGGLVGANESHSTVSDSSASATVFGTTAVGGLVGLNRDHARIVDSEADTFLMGEKHVGGLVGMNREHGSITRSQASGSVTGQVAVGGLVGSNRSSGVIKDSEASSHVVGDTRTGGLVGVNRNAVIRGSHASGSVSGGEETGGLVGANLASARIRDSSAEGEVTGTAGVGGLVGRNADGSAVVRSAASGAVSGEQDVGGLAGRNEDGASIRDSHASGTVTGTPRMVLNPDPGSDGGSLFHEEPSLGVGGLVGTNRAFARIEGSHASGSVTGHAGVGGLVGENRDGGVVADSYASGAVTGLAFAVQDHMENWIWVYRAAPARGVGGLVGVNGAEGRVERSYASGAVTASGIAVGGLVGENQQGGTIADSYASGAVTGTAAEVVAVDGQTVLADGGQLEEIPPTYQTVSSAKLGGLVGWNRAGATVRNSYASGAVAGHAELGGLVGAAEAGANVTASYWDLERSGQSASAGGVGLTSAQMTQAASFEGWDLATTGGSNAVWRLYEGRTAPLLRGFLKPLAVTVHDDGKTYDGLAYSGGPGMSITGAHDASLLFGQGSYAGSAQGAKDVGSYTIASGLYSVQQGYDIAETAGTLTITPAPLEVRVDDVSASQGQAFPGWTSRVSGLVGGERLEDVVEGTLRLQDPPSMTAAPGEYLLTPTGYVLRGGNYVLSYRAGTLHLAPHVPSTLPASYHAALHGAARSGQEGADGRICEREVCEDLQVPLFARTAKASEQDADELLSILQGGIRLPPGLQGQEP